MPALWRLAATSIGVTGLCAYSIHTKKISAKTKPLVARDQKIANAVYTARQIVTSVQNASTSPGISVCVSVDGERVWEEGFGYADLENNVPCSANSVMKIASISKPITMAMVAKQWEAKKLDLDADVASFVEGWPTKTWDGEKVSVTARQLANHMSGVRNYLKLEGANQKPRVPEKMQYEEYFITDHFKDVNAAMGLFKNDALVSKPGTEFLYSNHGYTVLAACIESAIKEKFTTYAKRFFKDLDMKNTYAEDDGTLMYNRSGQYTKTQSGVLINAPYVNPSFKIAGAGMWSSAIDLTKFGNAILSSYQNANASKYRTLLLPGTVRMLWTPAENVKCYWSQTGGYGLGWQTEPYDKKAGRIKDLNERFFVGHTGGTVGASSILWMLPSDGGGEGRPKGVVVAMISNLNVNMRDAATDIAKLFEDL